MMLVPSGVRVHIALGVTDMRKGLDGLAMLVQGVLEQDPFSGHLFAFRGRKANLIKIVFWDGTGLCLFTVGGGSLPLARRRRAWRHAGFEFSSVVDADRGHRLAHTGTDLAARCSWLSRTQLVEKTK